MQTVLRFLSHPITLCVLFCSLIISGESYGGVYSLILLAGLIVGALHSILGIAGVIMIIGSLYIKHSVRAALVRLAASVCLILSLIRFFTQPGGSYNYSTFHQFVPLTLFVVLSLSLLLFIFKQVQLLGFKKDRSVSAM